MPPYDHRAAGFDADPGPAPGGWDKYNAKHWRRDYRDFAEFFLGRVQNEPHSTKQREDAIADLSLGDGLPRMRDWVPDHGEFADYILGRHPSEFGQRDDLRAELGYDDGRPVCIVAVGGSAVGAPPAAPHPSHPAAPSKRRV